MIKEFEKWGEDLSLSDPGTRLARRWTSRMGRLAGAFWTIHQLVVLSAVVPKGCWCWYVYSSLCGLFSWCERVAGGLVWHAYIERQRTNVVVVVSHALSS